MMRSCENAHFLNIHKGRCFDGGVVHRTTAGFFRWPPGMLATRDANSNVFAAAEADKPRAGIVQVYLEEKTFDVVVTGGVHRYDDKG